MTDPTDSTALAGPRTDHDSYDVLDDALLALAQRRNAWLGDDLTLIHLLASLIEQAHRCLPLTVHEALANNASWDDIARALGTTPIEAQLRYHPDSPVADTRTPYNCP